MKKFIAFTNQYFSVILWSMLAIYNFIIGNLAAGITDVVVVLILFRMKQYQELIDSYAKMLDEAVELLKRQQDAVKHNAAMMEKLEKELRKLPDFNELNPN